MHKSKLTIVLCAWLGVALCYLAAPAGAEGVAFNGAARSAPSAPDPSEQAQAATGAVPPWPQEPLALYGVRLGLPLAEQVSECPRRPAIIESVYPSTHDPAGAGPCYSPTDGTSKQYFDLWNLTAFDAPVERAAVSITDGRVASVIVLVSPDQLKAFVSDVVARYGEPAYRGKRHWWEWHQSNAENWNWVGRTARLVLLKGGFKNERSALIFAPLEMARQPEIREWSVNSRSEPERK